MHSDLLLRVRLKTTAEGGRLRDINGPTYHCPLLVQSRGFDCRFLSFERVRLGVDQNIEVKLLDRESALPFLVVGRTIHIWEGRVIGEAVILRVFYTEQGEANGLPI